MTAETKKKICIAGCGGMLGDAFYNEFSDEYELKCTDIDVNEEWLPYLDFRDFDAYRKDVLDFSPNYLFHLGAYTDLEYCKLNPEDTYATNTKSVKHAVAIASELDIPLLYISTAGIFNGEKELYDDWDKPDPIGHYARSKYMAKKYVQEHAGEHLICRAGWMMGGGPGKDKKFIQKLMSQIQNSAKKLNIVLDKMGTPTYTHDFARNVKLLIEKGKTGLYNMVCQGVTSCLEVAQKLLKQLGLNGDIKINEVSSDHFKQEYFRSSTDSLT